MHMGSTALFLYFVISCTVCVCVIIVQTWVTSMSCFEEATEDSHVYQREIQQISPKERATDTLQKNELLQKCPAERRPKLHSIALWLPYLS